MGSKGRIPIHSRRPIPSRGMVHPEPFGPGMHGPPPGAFHSFDMSPPPEVMEQKLAAQHVEMDRIATENQRLAATHVTLRRELAGAQQELQMMQAEIGAVKSEREQQMGNLKDKMAKMESELQTSDTVQLQLQQARKDAQSLVVARQELIVKAQQMSQDLQRVHSDVQQVPALMSELENLRHEYQHCRATYDYEKKLYNDHLESLQVMEKNYITMAREVEKLRAELTNSANAERRSGGPYGNPVGYNENEAAGHQPTGKTSYQDGYGIPQGRGTFPAATASGVGGGGGSSVAPPYGAADAPPYGAGGAPPYGAAQPVPASGRPGYDPSRVPSFEAQRVSTYDPQRGAPYDAQRGYYDAQSSNAGGAAHGHAPPSTSAPYGSAASPPAHAGSGFDAQARGTNHAPR